MSYRSDGSRWPYPQRNPRTPCRRLLLMLVGVILSVFLAPTASADMCGPSNLPGLSFLYPYVKGCQPFVPGVALPDVPVVMPPATAPYPVYVPQIFPPVIPPFIPGVP